LSFVPILRTSNLSLLSPLKLYVAGASSNLKDTQDLKKNVCTS
jgi:hypothetical protein